MKKVVLAAKILLCSSLAFAVEEVWDITQFQNFTQAGVDFYNDPERNPFGVTVVIPTPLDVSPVAGEVIVPDRVNLRIPAGSILTVPANKNLVINGAIEAGAYKIFAGDGAVIGKPNIDYARPEWWGTAHASDNEYYFDGTALVPQRIADTTDAIHKAMALCPRVLFQTGVYKHNGIHITRRNVNLIGSGIGSLSGGTVLHNVMAGTNSITYNPSLPGNLHDGYPQITIRDMTIAGASDGDYFKLYTQKHSNTQHGISLGATGIYTWKPTIQNVQIEAHGGDGLHLIGQMGGHLENMFVTRNRGMGVVLSECNGTNIDTSTFRDNVQHNILIAGGGGISINNSNAENPEPAESIQMSGFSHIVVNGAWGGVNINGGYYENSMGSMIFLTNNARVNIRNAFLNNTVAGRALIDVYWADYVNVQGCVFANAAVALFRNTAQASPPGPNNDDLVLYYDRWGGADGQNYYDATVGTHYSQGLVN